MKTENALKKPQHAWIKDIDNSYNVFVPKITQKVHFKGLKGELQPEIVAMQKLKAEKPEEYRCLVTFGDHKKQLDNEELPNPYEAEIKEFDTQVKANNEDVVPSLRVPSEPTPYKSLDETPFTFVETEEQLEQMAAHLAQVEEVAIDLEHHSQRTYLGITCLM